jgi:hypothetical protein
MGLQKTVSFKEIWNSQLMDSGMKLSDTDFWRKKEIYLTGPEFVK